MDKSVLHRLVKVSRDLSSYDDLDGLVQSIVNMASELTGCSDSALLLFDEEENYLRYVAASWFEQNPGHRTVIGEIPVPLEQSVSGWVFSRSRPKTAYINGKDRALVYPEVEKHFINPVISIAAVPLYYQSLTIGVLETYNGPNGNYSPEDLRVLETLASQAAVAIYNAHLLHKTQQAFEELAEFDRMKMDFIAITSHELRTPLGVILGHTNLLKELVDEDIGIEMETIERNAMRLKEIVDDLSIINHISEKTSLLNTNHFSIKTLIKNSLTKFRDLARSKKIRLNIDLPEQGVFVLGDEEKIAIVLKNLIANALEFTPEGGKILVSARINGSSVCVSVIDNGVGIPENELSRVFDRFYQVESHMTRRHGGMGLGLSVAKFMIEYHGGELWVESIEGEGSNFSFELPLSIPENQNLEVVFDSTL